MQVSDTKKIISGLVLMLALALSAATAFAQGEPGGQGKRGEWGMRREHDGFGFFARGLSLSDAQKEQLRQIAARYQESTKSLREQLRSLHNNDFDPLQSGTFNEAAVRQAAQSRAAVEVELEVARARMQSEMYAVLTPEQKAQLIQQRQQWEQRRNTRRGATPGNVQ